MVKDAEIHAEEDKIERERTEVRNEADNLIYTTEKSLKDYGDKITADDRNSIETAVTDLRSSLEAGDAQDMKAKVEALKQAAYKLAEEVYKSQAGQQQPEDGEPAQTESNASAGESKESSGGETVEDADYEVVDEEDHK
jgi:molecular chaperone DnaK